MPLLRKKPFVAKQPPDGLFENSEVFFCQPTGEFFTEYDDFCERIIQCNSLVWSCSITGRSELTYFEAVQSEKENQDLLDQFPRQLRVPVLYLASVAQRTSFNQLIDELYMFMKERYFVTEKVEFLDNQLWNCGIIHAVSKPTADAIASCSGKSREKFFPPAASFQYAIRRNGNSTDDFDEEIVENVKALNIRRRQLLTKELVRLFLRQSAVTDARNVWVIKGSVLQDYGIHQLLFDSIFAGNPPKFPATPKKTQKSAASSSSGRKDSPKISLQASKSNISPKPSTSGVAKSLPGKGKNEVKKSRQEKIYKYLQPSKENSGKKRAGPVAHHPKKSPRKAETEGALSQKQLAKKVKEKYMDNRRKESFFKKQKLQLSITKMKEERKMKAVLEKRQRQEAMLQARAKKKEEKQQLEKFMREWKRQREDLECEDLKALPAPVPVVVRTPNEYFGDLVMILEFVHCFSEILKPKRRFSGALTFDLLERALLDCEVAGPLVDIITMFLKTLFTLQEKEDDEIDLTEESSVDVDIDGHMAYDISANEAVRLATAAAGWCKHNHGLDLSNVAINSTTVSEVLRLHLLASGGRAGENSAKWRYQQRGGFRGVEDPGLCMRFEYPHILRKLSHMSVCELSFEEKLAIISCLKNQVLTYTSVRNEIEERAEQLRVVKSEIRSLQVAEVKRVKEAHAKRMKEKKEAKLKLLKGEPQPAEPQQNEVPEAAETSEAAETEKLKLDKELNRRKAEVQKKASKMLTISMSHQLLPLGFDRAHRRYWLFQSLPGLFVEHDPRSAGPCLTKPTPHNPLARGDTLTYVRRLFEEECNAGSDKENDGNETGVSRPITSPNKKKLAEKNASVEERNHLRSGGKAPDVDNDGKLLSEVWGCTASSDCRVHCGDEVQWSFYTKEEDIATLIECLNPRGIRETELKNVLMVERERINASIRECPLHKLNKDTVSENPESSLRKSTRLTQSYTPESVNHAFPVGTPVPCILEQLLRDYILDTERKISSGSLGTVKVVDIKSWREALGNNSYEQLCDELKWGPPSEESDCSSEQGSQKGDVNESAYLQVEDEETVTSRGKAKQHKRKSGKSPEENYTGVLRVDSASVTPQPENPNVKNLASALLQLEQSLDLQYLKKPLGDKPKYSQLHRWEVSLMASTSLSQLFLHAKTLDMSIQWSKSALNAQCCLCRRRGDANKMLLCDGCNKGHHLYCLKPKLTKIPREEWFCSSCLEDESKKPSTSRKRIRTCSSEDDEEQTPARKSQRLSATQQYAVCNLCGLGQNLIECSLCPLFYHINCLLPQPKKADPGLWTCPVCEREGEESEPEPQDENAAHLLDVPNVRQRRGCTTATIAKIARFAKRLRSHSWDEDELGSDVPVPSRRSTRMSSTTEGSLDSGLMQNILQKLSNHVDSWPFLRPVRKSEAPDYHSIVKRPMDIFTIRKKLNSLTYTNAKEFVADVLLVFENCEMYNQVSAPEYKAGSRLLQYFKDCCADSGVELEPDTKERTHRKCRF